MFVICNLFTSIATVTIHSSLPIEMSIPGAEDVALNFYAHLSSSVLLACFFRLIRSNT